MSKNKVTNYFMPAPIENNVKETKNRNITIIEDQPQKETADPIIEVHKPFHPPTDFIFLRQNLEKDNAHVKHSGSNSSRGCIIMKGKGILITFPVQFGLLCFIAFPVLTFSLNYFCYYCCDFLK